MEYKKATPEDTQQIAALVQETIGAIYPRYYPQEVVEFFQQLHCEENIAGDIEAGTVGALWKDGAIVGTGCYQGNHIARVYVKPDCQGRGLGSCIMQCLEDQIGRLHKTACLDASLPACQIYEKRGYRTVCHKQWNVAHGAVLVYEVMEKNLRP